MRTTSAIVFVLAFVFMLAGCAKTTGQQPPSAASQEAAESKYELRWGTINVGGAWQVIGSAMMEDIKKANPNITGSTVPSSTTANVLGVHEGKFNIGFSLSDTTADAWEGAGYFKQVGKIRDIRELAALYPQATQIAVWADSGISSIEQLKGKRVSPGAKGLSCDLESQRLFKLYDMSYDDMQVQFLSFEDAAQQMADNHLDCLSFATVPFPFAPLVNINSQRQIKLLSIPDAKIAELTKFRGVEPFTLPTGLYRGVDYPVKGIAVRSHIIVREDMPDDVAYSIVKTIAENFERYPAVLKSMEYATLQDLPKDIGIPPHPGALKYYRERGWVK